MNHDSLLYSSSMLPLLDSPIRMSKLSIILRSDYTYFSSSILTFLRCFFEAQIQDPLLYRQLVSRLNGNVDFYNVALTPFDCMSVGYFLAFALRAGRLHVTFRSKLQY